MDDQRQAENKKCQKEKGGIPMRINHNNGNCQFIPLPLPHIEYIGE
jgi:hypothetical protein